MRIFAYILVAVGILMLAQAGYDEIQGITRAPSSRYARAHYPVTRAAKPEEFHNAMTYHWFCAALMGGVVAWLIDRSQERTDPMSPDYAGNQALDEWSEELKKEEDERQPPKP